MSGPFLRKKKQSNDCPGVIYLITFSVLFLYVNAVASGFNVCKPVVFNRTK